MVEWVDSVQIVSVTGIISFFIFFLMQVFWGDQLGSNLRNAYNLGIYVPSTLIIWTGILFIFVFGILIQIIAFDSYLLEQKIISSVLTMLFTLAILFFISWTLIDITYIEQKTNFEYFITIFSLYILPNPVWVWIITLIIFHVILAFFVKFNYVKKKMRY